ncbi:MAG: RpoL/Rpb11 RNA polymerase subunit family protein [Nanoarchaeota archaeon]
MDLKILNESKDEIQVEFDNLTTPELLRVYLNKDPAVSFVAWKREHPTKNPILVVRTSGKNPKKAINDSIKEITKELDKFADEIKKL